METNKGTTVKILLADDDAEDCELFRDALTEAKANAILATVASGEELTSYLAGANGNRPDIIFLDINMPRKDGKQCLKEIRRDQAFGQVPIIMLSTSSVPRDIEETFTNGANLYVCKPYLFKDEIEIITRIFSLNWQVDLFKPEREKFILK